MSYRYMGRQNYAQMKSASLLVLFVMLCLISSAQWRLASNTPLPTTSPIPHIIRTGKVIVGRVTIPTTLNNLTEARIEAFNGALAQVQAGSFGNYLTGNTWGGLGQAGTISSPITKAYGIAMIKNDRLGFYNLVDFTRNATATRDMVAGFGTNDPVPDQNQRFLIRYFTGVNIGGNIAPIEGNAIFSAKPDGSVGVNTEDPISTFFVDATNAVTTSKFRSMFLLNDGSINDFTSATFSSIGQEGNSTINAPIHGLRTQVGKLVAFNAIVNATNPFRQEAELTWQDLDYLGAVNDANGNQDRLTFYFRNGTNNPFDKRRAMTLLANSTTGIDVENPTQVGVNNASILFFEQKRNMRFDVPTAPMRSQSYYRLETERRKADVQDIPDALKRVLQLQGRTYLWLGYNNDQKTPTYGFNEETVLKQLPDAHIKHDDEEVSIDYDAILAAVVEAIKEMNGDPFGNLTEGGSETTATTLRDMFVQSSVLIQKQQQQIDQLTKQVEMLSAKAGITASSSDAAQARGDNQVTLQQNIPNPANGSTQIAYSYSGSVQNASLIITDTQGRIIKKYDNLAAGSNMITVNTNELKNGNYFYSLIINSKVAATKQMTVGK